MPGSRGDKIWPGVWCEEIPAGIKVVLSKMLEDYLTSSRKYLYFSPSDQFVDLVFLLMGILYLKKHLLPHASPIQIGDAAKPLNGGKEIKSVVIDGPSLVYHVYYCLLSRMGERFNAVDAQPSSNEVSIGTMRFLLHLRDLNVTVEKICFDGGLPLSKRPTRIERLESLKDSLDRLCHSSTTGFSSQSIRNNPLNIDAQIVFERDHSRPIMRNVPPNPFMVAAVIEDLKYRWDWNRINEYAYDSSRLEGDSGSFPWMQITCVVPGEADVYTAEAAKLSDTPVLTGDSDFLLHDLGKNGTVIFFDSLETMQAPAGSPERFVIHALELSPAVVSKKLGITNLQRLGFELKHSPSTGISTLVQRCKTYSDNNEPSDIYITFLREFEIPEKLPTALSAHPVLDPRISELQLQYAEIPGMSSKVDVPQIYLPFLIESYGRRCAWVEGREIRRLAYSLFDAGFPNINASKAVVEYTRRGGRICPTPVGLLGSGDTHIAVDQLLQKLNSMIGHQGGSSLISWKTFALSEIWRPSETNTNPALEPSDLRQFLDKGYSGHRLDWDDIHLYAQVQAVLYSLKVLKDLAAAILARVEGNAREMCVRVAESLSTLPPLYLLSQSRCELKSAGIPEAAVQRAVKTLCDLQVQWSEESGSIDDELSQSTHGLTGAQEPDAANEQDFVLPLSRGNRRKRDGPQPEGGQRPAKASINKFDILASTK